ncbi:unnamed protein product [Ixodes persulcatus]
MLRSLAITSLAIAGYLTVGCLASDGNANVSATICATTADCSEGQLCVSHYNYSPSSNCETESYCINVTDTDCSCIEGYVARHMNCPLYPYECIIIEHEDTRCEHVVCKEDELCAYLFMDVFCDKCPCYGTHNATCIPKTVECDPGSIVRQLGNETVCLDCASAVSVLTG